MTDKGSDGIISPWEGGTGKDGKENQQKKLNIIFFKLSV